MEAFLSQSPVQSHTRMFRGWLVVAGAFGVMLVGFGSAYTFGAFAESLQNEFGGSRGSTSLVFSLAGFLYFSLGVLSGPLADRWGARRLAVAGMILVGLGLVAASAARSLFEVYVAYGLGVGLGIGLSYVPVISVVQRWFARRRGLASGLAVSGIGLGTLVMPPLAAALIETLGWRGAYLVLGGVAAVVGVGMALLIENDPRDRGLGPDGDPITNVSAQAQGMSVGQAIRTRRFLILYVACVICSFTLFVPFVHLVPYAMDHGVTPASAVLLLGAIGIGSTIGRFFLGGLMDRIGRGFALVAMFIGMALALVVWAMATSWWPLAVFAFVYGMFYGGWVAILPAVVMDAFGGRHLSSIIGILYTSVALGTLIGPSAAGFAFDITQSYTLTIVAGICANILAAGIVATTLKMPLPMARELLQADVPLFKDEA